MKRTVCIILSVCLVFCLFSFPALGESALAYAVINGDTGEVLLEKNADARLPEASTTKIMTALLLCEKFPDLDTAVTVSDKALAVEGTSMGLKAGDVVTAYDLLYGMMLASGNDAANAAAIAVSGSIEEFVSLMNSKALALGLKNTHFNTPSGLDGESHYTTATELALITLYALQNENVAKAVSTKEITLKIGSPSRSIHLKNHNRLLFLYDDIIGVKTGYTSKAGRTLVSAAKQDGKYVIAVTLNDKNDWEDHRELIDKGYSLLKEEKAADGIEDMSLPLASGGETSVTLPKYKYFSAGNLKEGKKIYLPRFLYLPIKKGEDLGTIEYYGDYRLIKRISITAKEDIPLQKYKNTKVIYELFKLILTGAFKGM